MKRNPMDMRRRVVKLGAVIADNSGPGELGLPECTCGRGEGRHHPDCPEWDSHVDNYQADEAAAADPSNGGQF